MNEQKPTTYAPPKIEGEVKLQLSRNESKTVLEATQLNSLSGTDVSRYPSMAELQEALGSWLGVDPERIVVSAGGDDSLDRVIRLALRDRLEIATHAPSFEMVDVYADHYGGKLVKTTWQSGPFPTEPFISTISTQTGLAIVVSPNNPTGLTIDTDSILKIADAAAAAGCRLMVDNAYVEFADEDPTAELIAHPNIMVLRTFSKAWGMAGLRVGYLIAPTPEEATTIRNATGPFPVARTSLQFAEDAVRNCREQMEANVDRTKHYRQQLIKLLTDNDISVSPSEGNFVLIEHPEAESIWRQLAELGIAVRYFPNRPLLENQLRVTVPPQAADFLHLAKGLGEAMSFTVTANQLSVLPSSESEASTPVAASHRTARIERKTKETDIVVDINLDGTGQVQIETGIGFLDHMLTAFAFHSRFDLTLTCSGDLHIDDHHTAEDCALALGSAIDHAIGPRTGIVRFGFAYAPLDEALARSVLDLSGRPWPSIHLDLQREMVGTIATENITHVLISLAMALKCSLHVDVLRGDNDHHKAEAAFKSLALAFRQALQRTAGSVPSTKGVL